MTQGQSTELTVDQESALGELKDRLQAYAERHPVHYRNASGPNVGIDWTDSPESYNVFGIHGARGLGKSTLLRQLYHDWGANGIFNHRHEHGNPLRGNQAVDDPERRAQDAKKLIIMLPPLDCSSIPADVTLGVAVLVKLSEHLVRLPLGPDGARLPKALIHDEGQKANHNDDVWPLSELIGLYSRSEQGYRDLVLELATSPDDYSHYSWRAVTERMQLGPRLRAWLDEVLRCLGSNVFIVPLDDFDLVPAVEVRRFLRSLLDEMQQDRLVFVVTADWPRLQHLSWDARAGFDDKTGRALLDKLLPRHNRVHLLDWTPGARKDFVPVSARQEAIARGVSESCSTMGRLLENEYRRITESPREESRLDPEITARRLALILALLPAKPRGLETLYRYLDRREKKSRENEQRDDNKEPFTEDNKDAFKMFLERIASCRAESLLARRFQEADLVDIARTMKLSDRKLTVEQWSLLVERAAALATKDKEMTPLPIALAGQGASASESASVGAGNGTNRHERLISAVEDISEAADTHWGAHDPLRHEALTRAPLRDTADDAMPFWVELLLDIAFERAPQMRISLVEDWVPLKQRSGSARVEFSGSRDALRSLFEDDGCLSHQAALYWLDVSKGADRPLSIGWQPMLEALRGAREPLSFKALGTLLLDTTKLRGKLPRERAEDVLPCTPRGLILLVDALHRCPWDALRLQRAWDLATHLCISAALTSSAYLFAWYRSLGSDDQQIQTHLAECPEQWGFYQIIESRHPQALLGLNEDAMVRYLGGFFDKSGPKIGGAAGNPIAQARDRFVNSPVYTEVAELSTKRAAVWQQRDVQAHPGLRAPIDDSDAKQD